MKTIITTNRMYASGEPFSEENCWKLINEIFKVTGFRPRRLILSPKNYTDALKEYENIIGHNPDGEIFLFGLKVIVDRKMKAAEWLLGNLDESVYDRLVAA